MGEEIKYEPVFGDQSLFEDAPDDAIAIRVNDYKLITYYFLTEEHLALTNSRELKAIPIIAMRRIIKTPVISGDIDDLIKDEFSEWWEKEGCLVRSGGGDRERTFAFAAFRKLMPEILAARGLKKTPTWTMEDQKAGRDAWARKASEFIDDELDCVNLVGEHVMRRFYNAMLSGELAVPKGW